MRSSREGTRDDAREGGGGGMGIPANKELVLVTGSFLGACQEDTQDDTVKDQHRL